MTSPPKRNMANNTKKVLNEVLNVRLNVLFNAELNISLRSRFFLESDKFSDPVKNNHRVVDGVSNHCKDGGYKRLIEL